LINQEAALIQKNVEVESKYTQDIRPISEMAKRKSTTEISTQKSDGGKIFLHTSMLVLGIIIAGISYFLLAG